MDYLSAILLMLTGIFLILLVLIQRGRGGGLAGAFGGMGGQSAFGTKAGDVFTKITVGVAVAWVFFAGASIWFFQANSSTRFGGGDAVEGSLTAGAASDADKDGENADKDGENADKDGEKESAGGTQSKTSDKAKNEGAGGDSKSDAKGAASKESSDTPPAEKSAEKPE